MTALNVCAIWQRATNPTVRVFNGSSTNGTYFSIFVLHFLPSWRQKQDKLAKKDDCLRRQVLLLCY